MLGAGLWHADEEPIVSDLLSKACDDLNEALASGDCYKARLLLRLLASLTIASVISIQSFLGTLNTIAAAANQILQEGQPGCRHKLQTHLLPLVFDHMYDMPPQAQHITVICRHISFHVHDTILPMVALRSS